MTISLYSLEYCPKVIHKNPKEYTTTTYKGDILGLAQATLEMTQGGGVFNNVPFKE